MSFFDDAPELAADLRDVFNILYPPSPTSTTLDDWEEAEEESTKQVEAEDSASTAVNLDGPVNDLPPLDVHETHAQSVDRDSTSKTHGYVQSLMSKLSRKRIRSILDSTLPLIGHPLDVQEKAVKKRKLIEILQPGIHVPDRAQSQSSTSQRPASRTSTTTATTAKRNRQRSLPIAPSHPGTHPAYNPFSAISYLSRLRTFSLTSYPTKPPALSPQACAQGGWIHEGGKDRLFCRVCQNAWRVEVPGDVVGGIRLSAPTKQKYIQLLAKQLVLAHVSSCPWRVRQCPPTIHQDLLMLNPPISSHLASAAVDLESCVLAKGETPSVAHFEEADFELVSPLTATEVSCLTKNLNLAVDAEGADSLEPEQPSTSKPEHATRSTAISSTAAILAFFGWNVFRPGSPDPVVEEKAANVENSNNFAIVPDVLRCKICDRKIGLWAFRQTPSRSSKGGTSTAKELDVVLEHREFCPIRTLSGKPVDKEGHDAWWTGAAILLETPIRNSPAVERINQQDVDIVEDRGTSLEGGPDVLGLDDRNDVGSVVAKLKTFIG